MTKINRKSGKNDENNGICNSMHYDFLILCMALFPNKTGIYSRKSGKNSWISLNILLIRFRKHENLKK